MRRELTASVFTTLVRRCCSVPWRALYIRATAALHQRFPDGVKFNPGIKQNRVWSVVNVILSRHG